MRLFLCFVFLMFHSWSRADESVSESEAYWDYGLGVGAVRFEHYPGSDQFSYLALPAPTFQYRGKILRADDREGAHLYLLKSGTLTLELSGAGFPALDSSGNDARKDMEDLPWLLAMGPQLVSRAILDVELGLGVYQAVSSDFRMTRFAGQIFEAKSTFFWSGKWRGWNLQPNETGFIDGRLSISLKGASRDLQGLYYDVPIEKSTTARPVFDARAGLLSTDISYFQRFKTGKASFFFGVGLSLYQWAENKNSPLHRSDTNMTALVGLNYILGGSERPAVPQEDTSGLINTIRRKNEPF